MEVVSKQGAAEVEETPIAQTKVEDAAKALTETAAIPPVLKQEIKPTDKPADSKESTETVDNDFDLEVDESTAEPVKSAFDKTKWKELDEDLDPEDESFEDKLFERAKGYKQKANDYLTVAQANELVEKDKDIVGARQSITKLNKYLNTPDRDLVYESEKAILMRNGKKEDEAAQEAEETVKQYESESPSFIKFQSNKLRSELKDLIGEAEGFITNKSEQIKTHINQTRKALSLSDAPNPELVKKAMEVLEKTDNFLGLKFGGKSPQAVKDFLKPVMEGIKNGTILKAIQSDPELLIKAGLLKVYGDKFAGAIDKRGKSVKTKVVDELNKAPHSNGSMPSFRNVKDAEPTVGLKDPANFK